VWFLSVMFVGDCRRWCCRWFRRKLWHKPIIVFQLFVKYRWNYSIGDGRRWLPSESPSEIVATLCNLFPTLCEILMELFRRFNIYAASTWIFFYSPAHLDHTQRNNRSWQLKKNKYFMFQNITL
jgi:hypothetical protein